MTEKEFKRLVAKFKTEFESLSPEAQAAYREARRQLWVRGELALAKDINKTINPDGSVTYHDYESYCSIEAQHDPQANH